MTPHDQSDTAAQRLRMIYLSQLFDPEPTFKGYDFVRGLEDRGLKVEVVTGFPNYPGGKLYDSYTIRPISRELFGETIVTRLAMYPSHDASTLRRMATYLSFMVTSFLYLTFRTQRSDVLYVYYPALTAGLAAIAAKLFRRTPVLLDVQDMWPDSLASSGMMRNRFFISVASAACSVLYKHCDHILVLSPGFKKLLVERGVPSDKITVVYNWTDETFCAEARCLSQAYGTCTSFRILFAGNMGAAQQLDTVIDAASYLQSINANCIFYFMGGGIEKDRLATRARDLGLSNVRFLPGVPLKDVQGYLAGADALLVHLADKPLHRITIPSKTQAYMRAGRPILMGVAGDAADLVREADAGYLFEPENPRSLVESVIRLMSDDPSRREQMGSNAKRYYAETLSRSRGIDATVHLITRFCPKLSNKRGAQT